MVRKREISDSCVFCKTDHNFGIYVNLFCIYCGKQNPQFDQNIFLTELGDTIEEYQREVCSDNHQSFLEENVVISQILKAHILDSDLEVLYNDEEKSDLIKEHFMESLPIANWKGKLGRYCPYCGGDFAKDLKHFMQSK